MKLNLARALTGVFLICAAHAHAVEMFPSKPDYPRLRIAPIYVEMTTAREALHVMDKSVVTRPSTSRFRAVFTEVESAQVSGNSPPYKPWPLPPGGELVLQVDANTKVPFADIRSFVGGIDKTGPKPVARGRWTLTDGRQIEVEQSSSEFGPAVCGELNGRPQCVSVRLVGSVEVDGKLTRDAKFREVRGFESIDIQRSEAVVKRMEAQLVNAQQSQDEGRELNAWRERLAEGDGTQCGMVIQVRPNIAEVQGRKGTRWIKRDELYPLSAGKSCTT
jgi:hypothetical protein